MRILVPGCQYHNGRSNLDHHYRLVWQHPPGGLPTLLNVLDDYAVHKSPFMHEFSEPPEETIVVARTRPQRQPSAFDPTLAVHPRVSYPVTNTTWWEDTYRRLPEYRPLIRDLDPEERRQNIVFQRVGRVMVFGCMTISVSNETYY